jgi:CHAT domain-containing protein
MIRPVRGFLSLQFPRPIFVALSVLVIVSVQGWQQSAAKSNPVPSSQQPAIDDVRPLVPGLAVTREIPGGQRHLYHLSLGANQLVKVFASQRGADVVLRLHDMDGRPIAGAESNRWSTGLEMVLWHSQSEGIYRVEVEAPRKTEAAGQYEIRVETFPATADLLAAFQKEIEARRLLSQRSREKTQEALRLNQEHTERAIILLEESLPAWRLVNDPQMEALTLIDLALKYLGSDQKKCLDYYRQSAPIFRSVGMKAEEARALSATGTMFAGFGNNREALRHFEQALELYDYLSPSAGLHLLLDLGDSYDRFGEVGKGEEYHQRALSIARRDRNRIMELSSLRRLGYHYLLADDLVKSQECINAAIPLAREFKDISLEAILLSYLGRVYLKADDDQKALEVFERSLDLHQAPAVRSFMQDFSIADRKMDIGDIYRRRGDLQKAMELYKEGLAKFQSRVLDGEARALSSIGRIHLARGESRMAQDHLDRALKIWRDNEIRWSEVEALVYLSDASEQMGDGQRARALLEDALSRSRQYGNYEGEAAALIRLARLAEKSGNLNEARGLYEKSLSVSEDRRLRFGTRGLRELFGANIQPVYGDYTRLLMQLHRKNPQAGEDKLAFQTCERSKVRGLLELLSESRADIRQGADPAMLEKERLLQQRLNNKDSAWRQFPNRKNSGDQAESMRKEIDSLITELQLVQAQIRASSPRYAALTQPQPLSATDIQQLLDDDTVLIEFALGKKQSWLWAMTPKSLHSYSLPSEEEVEAAARKVYELLTSRQPKKNLTEEQHRELIVEADAKLESETSALSRMILGPIASRLGDDWRGKRLIVVASGALEYLPFAALPIPSENTYQPLLASHEVVSLPSASVLAEIRSETAGRRPAAGTLAIIADPVFDPNDPRVLVAAKRKSGDNLIANVRSADESTVVAPQIADPDLVRAASSFNRAGFSRLPFSREEADKIAELVPKNSLLKAVDFQAARTLATSGELGRYRIVHFATHGLLNSEHPELSGLVLSLVDADGKTRDGFLRMHEIFNLQLPADLVVLSACQTALGKEIKGEGLMGLTRGFLYAGAERVVASLWQVDDLATAELMKRFYNGMLKEGMRPAAALRAAQLEIMKQKRWSSPYYWGAFTLQGEWR